MYMCLNQNHSAGWMDGWMDGEHHPSSTMLAVYTLHLSGWFDVRFCMCTHVYVC